MMQRIKTFASIWVEVEKRLQTTDSRSREERTACEIANNNNQCREGVYKQAEWKRSRANDAVLGRARSSSEGREVVQNARK
jgi:hypothetical protein